MARESMRKRFDRRFGKAERLADLVSEGQWSYLPGSEKYAIDKYAESKRSLVRSACVSKVIEATNVYEYVASLEAENKKAIGWKEMIVNAMPPFDFQFVEMAIKPEDSPQVRQIGWTIESFEKGCEPPGVHDAAINGPYSSDYEKCSRVVIGTMVIRMLVEPSRDVVGLLCPTIDAFIFLDEQGASLQPPMFSVPSFWVDLKQDDWITGWGMATLFDVMLSFCFINCKNVQLVREQPNERVNRERVKAGIKPFVQYHTIDIDPMKEVLCVEGDIKSNGLKKALHICRGHFVKLTRNNKGELLEEPTTYFRASHIRGHAKNGIVVSDYNVKSPSPREASNGL